MRRREFITLLGGAAAPVFLPLKARAQQPMPVVALVRVTSEADSAHLAAALRKGLEESGYVPGQNVAMEYRYANNQRDRLPALIADVIGRRAAVIVTDQAVRQAKAATSTVPILFALGADPVTGGIIPSFSHPGGNVTGAVFFSAQLGAKRFGLMMQLVPQAKTIGLLAYPDSPEDQMERRLIEDAAQKISQPLVVIEARVGADIDAAFATFAERGVGALLVGSGPFFRSHKEQIVGLAARQRLPASYSLREYVAAGGLMGYGTSITDAYRQLGVYAARILKGEKPGDLPVMQPTRFELVINVKTAKTLGVAIPAALLATADEVIE
jgi:putative ABC transport system substrate-binding protein